MSKFINCAINCARNVSKFGGSGVASGLLKLIMSQTGEGTITPSVGEHKYKKGTSVTIAASETDEDYYLENFSENDQVLTNELEYSFAIDSNRSIIVFFNEKLTQVFESYAVYQDNLFKFLDLTSKNNDIVIKKSRGRKFDGASTYIITLQKIVGRATFDVHFKFKTTTINGDRVLFGTDRQSNLNKGFQIRVTSAGALQLVVSNGATATALSFLSISNNTLYTCRFQWSGISGDIAIMTVNGSDYTITTDRDWTGDSYSTLLIGYMGSAATIIYAELYYLFGKFGNVYYEYLFNTTQGTTEYDTGGHANHGAITTNNMTNFVSPTHDDYPACFMYGASLFRNNSDLTYHAVPCDKNNAELVTTLTGYSYLGKKTGIMIGCPNKLTIPQSADMDDALEDSGLLTNTEYTPAQLIAATGAYISKTEDSYSITKLLVKKKFELNNTILTYSENTIYNEQTSY